MTELIELTLQWNVKWHVHPGEEMQIVSQLSIKFGFSAYRNTQTLNVSQYKTYQSNKRARTATIQPSKIPFIHGRKLMATNLNFNHTYEFWTLTLMTRGTRIGIVGGWRSARSWLSSTTAGRHLPLTWVGEGTQARKEGVRGAAPQLFFGRFLSIFGNKFLVFTDRILGNRDFLVVRNRTLQVSSRVKDWCVEVHTSYPHGAGRSFGEKVGWPGPCPSPGGCRYTVFNNNIWGAQQLRTGCLSILMFLAPLAEVTP